MQVISSSDITARKQARTIYASFIKNQQDLADKVTVRQLNFLESDLMTRNVGALFTTPQEQQAILYKAPSSVQLIVSGNKVVSGNTSGLTQINFTGIYDAGYGSQAPIAGVLDDAFIPIPMGGMTFNFFGINYTSSMSWNSNNALVFGSTFAPTIVSISATTTRAILLGNYDRMCSGLYYTNAIAPAYSVTTLIVTFYNYYTDTSGALTYKYQIRLIKENTGYQRQFIEVCIVSSPPSTGYNSSGTIYPSGVDVNGRPVDSSGNIIDQTKISSYNITNGTAFLNPCGSTFSLASPAAGTSFVFSSDATGSNWTFNNNAFMLV
jgi:hypothetical protein